MNATSNVLRVIQIPRLISIPLFNKNFHKYFINRFFLNTITICLLIPKIKNNSSFMHTSIMEILFKNLSALNINCEGLIGIIVNPVVNCFIYDDAFKFHLACRIITIYVILFRAFRHYTNNMHIIIKHRGT
jgi:hypothetical protein